MTIRRKNGKFAPNPNPTPAQLKRRQRDAARKARKNQFKVKGSQSGRIPQPYPNKLNLLGYILDRSGSMARVKEQAFRAFKTAVKTGIDNAQEYNQNTVVTTGAFAGNLIFTSRNEDSQKIQWDRQLHAPTDQWGTALEEATIRCMETMLGYGKQYENLGWDVSYLLHVITDGEENKSDSSYHGQLKERLELWNRCGNITVGFSGPKRCGYYYTKLGIPSGNQSFWEATEASIQQELSPALDTASTNFFQARSRGAQSTTSLFLDLSKADHSLFTSENDVASKFQMWKVERGEESITNFVNYKLSNPNVRRRIGHNIYKIGNGYYQLSKKETIQPTKKVVVQDKKTGIMIDGKDAKTLLGISGNARVDPQNLSHYNVFVQSTSPNRKLVRGTCLLYLKSKTSSTRSKKPRGILGKIAHRS